MKNLEEVLLDFNSQIPHINSKKALEEIKVKFLGKKSELTEAFSALKNLANEEKKSFGALINGVREQISKRIDELEIHFKNLELENLLQQEEIDITQPHRPTVRGLIHPLSKAAQEIRAIFTKFGFEFSAGPEIEDDFHNFTALNMAKDHPARQMQDTFYFNDPSILLRTHTSNTQIRKMLTSKPPLKIASLGRVFRKDYDQTHTPMFHQCEGLVIDKDVNMGQLKWVLEAFLAEFFNTNSLKLRFRPSFFPFTEPSAEVDINYKIDQGRIIVGQGDKFMEILGCGMVNPKVLENCKIDPKEFNGFAFGIGVERLAMLKYGIRDLRMLFENDLRFLKHFGFNA